VFRHPLRSAFLLLMASFAAAPAARAAVLDITDAKISITIARTTLAQDDLDATIRVEGTGLNNGTITIPTTPTSTVALDNVGGTLGLDFHFTSEAQLNAALPNGTYVLKVNNDTNSANLVYTRPAVPSPAISFPSGGEVIPPGPVTVEFTSCPICNQIGDSVNAVLDDDMMVELDSEALTSSSNSWTPQDMSGDLQLPEGSAFTTQVTHKAVRQANVTVTGTDSDNSLLFTNTFIQSDLVDFETGFNPPAGHFCLAANHPAPPSGCNVLSDPALQLFDTSGTTATTVAGHDVQYTVSVGADGNLTGTAVADLDDNASNETGPLPLKGKLGGGNGTASSKLSFSLTNMGLAAKLKVSVTDSLSIPTDTRTRLQRASGSIGGTKIKEDVPSTDTPLPDAPLGWVLEYDLAADGTISAATLKLEGGRTFTLTGANKFNIAANTSSLKLASNPKGISVQLKGVGLDDSTSPMTITSGAISYKALGQSGRSDLP